MRMAAMTSVPDVLEILRGVIDPDVGIDVVELGLIESVEVTPGRVRVGLIMTTPACPQSSYLCDEAAQRLLLAVPSGTDIDVAILAEPLWQPERLSDKARALLGWPG